MSLLALNAGMCAIVCVTNDPCLCSPHADVTILYRHLLRSSLHSIYTLAFAQKKLSPYVSTWCSTCTLLAPDVYVCNQIALSLNPFVSTLHHVPLSSFATLPNSHGPCHIHAHSPPKISSPDHTTQTFSPCIHIALHVYIHTYVCMY